MESKTLKRKQLVPKLNLSKLSTKPNDSLTSRETYTLINSQREIESNRLSTFDCNRYSSSRPELWSPSMFDLRNRNNKITRNEYNNLMYKKIWKDTEQELNREVTELTLKLDKIKNDLSTGILTFRDAGLLLSAIRLKSKQEHHKIYNNNNNDCNNNKNDNDLIFCLDLVEKLWECINNDGLSCSEFSELLSNMLNKNKNEFDVLFQKMDADGDETLSWGEYVGFLLQQQSHLWNQQENKNVSYYQENLTNLYTLNGNGNNMINKIDILNGELTSKTLLNSSKYAIITSDHCVQIRNAMTLKLESNIDLTLRIKKDDNDKYRESKNNFQTKLNYNSVTMRNRAAQQDASANRNRYNSNCTNICALNNDMFSDNDNSKLAISFMDRAVNIYSPSFNPPANTVPIYLQTPTERKRYNNKIHYHINSSFYALDIPQCMELFNETSLLVGETYGTIGLYNYSNHNCLIRSKIHGASTDGPCVIKQVKQVPRIGIVSCGMDNNIIVTDQTKWCISRTLTGHLRGVYSIGFSMHHRMLVSAGYDRKIIVWDPYVVKPLGLLRGHVSSIVGVLINDQSNQIITASQDKKIKIWDVRTWKCLQTMRDTSIHQPINQLTAIQYDSKQSCLITGGSKVRKWYFKDNNNNEYNNNTNNNPNNNNQNNTKLASIVSINYSPTFKQIISVHVDDRVILWDVETGENSFEFEMNSDDIISTSTMDKDGKRLLTASQNGNIKMWNFNNGAVMHEFDQINFEITKLIYLPHSVHCVVVCGFNDTVLRFPSHQAPPEANFVLKNAAHSTDVRSMCIADNILLTGSSDGKIIEWYVDSNIKTATFTCPLPYTSITEMYISLFRDYKYYLFVGTEEGVLHMFKKDSNKQWKFMKSFKNEKNNNNNNDSNSMNSLILFKEPILKIIINEPDNTRLLIADCDINCKLYDIRRIHQMDNNHILLREWIPHNNGCITDLLYIRDFNVFCSSSDNGELILWNLDGINLAQFGQNNKWNLYLNNLNNNNKENQKNNKSLLNEEEKTEEFKNQNQNKKQLNSISKNQINFIKKRKSYFDNHSIYKPKFIKSVVTESIARTLLDDRTNKNKQKQKQKIKNKTQFEQNLDKLMLQLMKPVPKIKKKRISRRTSIWNTGKTVRKYM